MDSTPTTASVLEDWVAWMRAQDLTDRTVKDRIDFIRRVERVVGSVLECQRADLIRYLGSDPTWSNTTKQHYRSGLHTFFTWMQDEGYRPDNPAARLPRVKPRKRQPTPLTPVQIELALAAGAYKRTRRMIALHYYLGLRVAEISRVHGGDVDWRARTLTTIGKGRKKVTLPIPEALWSEIQDAPRDAYWFPNWKANRLFAAGEGHILSNSVSTLIAQALRRAGITGHRPHDLRAATATEQHRAGVPAFVIQHGMRHAKLDTTSLYTLVDDEEIRAGLERLPVVQMPTRSGRGNHHDGEREAA